MADLLLAVADGPTQFDPDQLRDFALRYWPTSQWGDPDDQLAQTLARQITVQDHDRHILVDILASRGAISIEGDDELAAQFIAGLTQNIAIPEGEIALMNWSDDIFMLRQHMTVAGIWALRG